MNSNFKSAQRRYDNLSEEDCERRDTREARCCKTCGEWFKIDRLTQHICEECDEKLSEL